jgi:hypothetical protein
MYHLIEHYETLHFLREAHLYVAYESTNRTAVTYTRSYFGFLRRVVIFCSAVYVERTASVFGVTGSDLGRC